VRWRRDDTAVGLSVCLHSSGASCVLQAWCVVPRSLALCLRFGVSGLHDSDGERAGWLPLRAQTKRQSTDNDRRGEGSRSLGVVGSAAPLLPLALRRLRLSTLLQLSSAAPARGGRRVSAGDRTHADVRTHADAGKMVARLTAVAEHRSLSSMAHVSNSWAVRLVMSGG
jgi:hypothetical protein